MRLLPEAPMRRTSDYQIPPAEDIALQQNALRHVVKSAVYRFIEHHSKPTRTLLGREACSGFFSIPLLNGVMDITCIGEITEPSHNGLFIGIHVKSTQGVLAQKLHIQIPKQSDQVDKEEAVRMLRWYRPEKMELLAGLIRNAIPISDAEYFAFIGPPQEIMPVVSF